MISWTESLRPVGDHGISRWQSAELRSGSLHIVQTQHLPKGIFHGRLQSKFYFFLDDKALPCETGPAAEVNLALFPPDYPFANFPNMLINFPGFVFNFLFSIVALQAPTKD